MISKGKKLRAKFKLTIVQSGAVREVVFADLLTRRTIVSVYMKNNTGSCDKQNDSLAAHAAEFDRAGYNLVALSRDTGGSHLKYAAKKKSRMCSRVIRAISSRRRRIPSSKNRCTEKRIRALPAPPSS